jgi:hypothetical protein
MSVIEFTEEEIGQLAFTIIMQNYQRVLFTSAEIAEMEKEAEEYKKELMDWQNVHVVWFFDRLYFSNQIAYYRQYVHDRNDGPIQPFVSIKSKHITGEVLSKKEFLEKLTSLRYNLADNAGRTFICPEDSQRLDDLISSLAVEIAVHNMPRWD